MQTSHHKTESSESQNSVPEDRKRYQGKVSWFSSTRGYGFIKPEDPECNDGKEVFVHFHYIVQRGFKSLRENDLVEFCIGENKRGVCAQDVKLVKAAEEVS